MLYVHQNIVYYFMNEKSKQKISLKVILVSLQNSIRKYNKVSRMIIRAAMSLNFFDPRGFWKKGEMNFLAPGVRGVNFLTHEELGHHLIVFQTKKNPLFLGPWTISDHLRGFHTKAI